MNNSIKIEKQEKDGKSFSRCTNLIKKLNKPLLNKEGYTKKIKNLYMYNEPKPCRLNPKACKSTTG